MKWCKAVACLCGGEGGDILPFEARNIDMLGQSQENKDDMKDYTGSLTQRG